MNLPERYLYHIWDARHFVPDMKTMDNKPIKILFPGHFNTNAGPDYHHAVLEIEGKVKRGDIEIHCKTSDWMGHRHHEDPIYNNVILHVVYEHNSKYHATITENGNIIDILELKSFLDADISKLTPPSEPISGREPLCRFFAGLEPDQTKIFLNHYGMERLHRRIARFKAELHFNSIDQLIYQSFMEAMGYRQNQFPFLILAEQLPYRQLQAWKKNGMTMDDMTAIFLCSSGLVISIKQEDEASYWLQTYKKQKYFQQHIPCEWNHFRIRPAHQSLNRIQLFRNFLFHTLHQSLHEQIHAIFMNQGCKSAKSLENELASLMNQGISLVHHDNGWGKNMLRLLIINALLPIEILYARKRKDIDLESYLVKLYIKYPGLPENAQIRDMKRFMTDNQSRQLQGSALRQLGLQQLYRENCMIHDCDACMQSKIKLISNL